ncbi:MAG TPA: DUF4397 domain-containing protein [Flavisolibacter sp.]|nr:DUF4397 domain-containing protein [Flavisolibacter sp.]
MIRHFFVRRTGVTLGLLFTLSIVLSSCLKDNENVAPTPVAALMAFNLAPDQQGINIGLSGNALPGGALPYAGYTGRYLNVYPGNRMVEAVSAVSGQRLDSLSFNFQQSKFYSLFVVGNAGTYRNVLVEDNYDSLTASSGKAYVRFINALSNAPSSNVVITSNGTNLFNSSAAFGDVSGFVAVNPGEVTVQVSNEGAVSANRTITLSQQKAYTVLLTGLPNQTDASKEVQIRFVENGTVTD